MKFAINTGSTAEMCFIHTLQHVKVTPMHVVMVRTKLESIIVLELIDQKILTERFCLIEMFQFHKNEDDKSVYYFYKLLSKKALFKIQIVESKGFIRSFSKIFLLLLIAKLTFGKFLYATVGNYQAALAIKLLQFKNLYTFDNGSVNVDPTIPGSFFRENILGGKSWKRFIARSLFPKGSNTFIRSGIKTHYTLFKNHQNIPFNGKVIPILINWDKYLIEEDTKYIDRNCKVIFLGTVYKDHPDQMESLMKIRNNYLEQCDMYIPHPREKIDFVSKKIIKMGSPSESIINYIGAKNKVRVLHFNSTVAMLMGDNEWVEFKNLSQ